LASTDRLFPRTTEQLFGVALEVLVILILRVNVGVHRLNCRQLVTADFPRLDLIRRLRHIEVPTLGCFQHRYRQLPRFPAYVEVCHVPLLDNLMADFPVAKKTGDGFRIGLSLRQVLTPVLPSRSLSAVSFCVETASASAVAAFSGVAKYCWPKTGRAKSASQPEIRTFFMTAP
jgi:hypothetical protein